MVQGYSWGMSISEVFGQPQTEPECSGEQPLGGEPQMVGDDGIWQAPTASVIPGLLVLLIQQGLTCSSLITDLLSTYHITATGIQQ